MRTQPILGAALALALLAGSAAASPTPPGDPPPSGGDGTKNHVHRLKPWKAKFEYRMVRDAVAHDELNARADLQAQVVKGQWWPIDCQLYNRTQNGVVLWNHIHNVGWVADQAMKTYSDGRLEGAPTCAKPGAAHVWFKQRWASGKQYRAAHRAQARDRPGGAPVAKVVQTGEWNAVNCHQAHKGRQWVFIDFPGAASGYIPADALRFWQKGLPAGMPPCVKPPPPVRTWVAMGDSYAAGQGANDYSGGHCRRSANSYWALLHGSLRNGLTSPAEKFVACSGATTATVRADQLAALDPTTRLVTISVGGNDLGFAGVLTACVEPFGQVLPGGDRRALPALGPARAAQARWGASTATSAAGPPRRRCSCSATRSSSRATTSTAAARWTRVTRRRCTAPPRC